jgi:hypothetical protein
MKEYLIDKRVVKRALEEGLLDKAVYQRMLDALPDLSHKVQAPESPEAAAARAPAAVPQTPQAPQSPQDEGLGSASSDF